MDETNQWLISIAEEAYPDMDVPRDLELSTNLTDAWRQVCSLARIQAQELAAAVAEATQNTLANTAMFDADAINLVSERMCRKHRIVPVALEGSELIMAIANPYQIPSVDQALKFAINRRCSYVILAPDDIDTYTTHLYAQFSTSVSAVNVIDLDRAEAPDQVNVAIVRLARAIFTDAINKGASDVHIQPFAGGGAIRFRIDGRMRRIGTVPAETLGGLSRYLIAQCGGDTSRLMEPQDGRIRLQRKTGDYDVRMSFLPSYGGIRTVARLLSQSQQSAMSTRGFSAVDLQALRRMSSYASGLILMTGPTGSGKTTTLYGLLAELNRVDVTVITLENPVEYVLPGTSQVNIDTKRGTSFASSLRAVLRQDPDIILVGEIRDEETAQTAAQAALTGHLVFSTLHTNDVLSTIPRLAGLNVEKTIIADSLVGIVSQRLLPKLCEDCALPHTEKLSPLEAQFLRITGDYCAKRPLGCEKCGFTGYSGRTPVLEWLEISPKIKSLLLKGETDTTAIEAVLGTEYRSMASSVADALVSGITSIEAAHSSLGVAFWHGLAKINEFPVEDLQLGGMANESGSEQYSLLMLTDDANVCSEVSKLIGLQVTQVGSIQDARKSLAADSSIAAVVADSRLAQTEAIVWLREMRSELAWSGLPVVFLSDSAELNETLKEHGASVIEGFPIDVHELGQALRAHLQ